MFPDLASELLISVGSAALKSLLAAASKTLILGAAICGFSAAGIGLIIGSSAVTGWWQPALLGFGTSLLFVGTVQLGLLGVISKLTGDQGIVLHFADIDEDAAAVQVGALLRQLASRIEGDEAVAAKA